MPLSPCPHPQKCACVWVLSRTGLNCFVPCKCNPVVIWKSQLSLELIIESFFHLPWSSGGVLLCCQLGCDSSSEFRKGNWPAFFSVADCLCWNTKFSCQIRGWMSQCLFLSCKLSLVCKFKCVKLCLTLVAKVADVHAGLWWHFSDDWLEPTVFLSPLNLWQKPTSNQNSFLAFVSIS